MSGDRLPPDLPFPSMVLSVRAFPVTHFGKDIRKRAGLQRPLIRTVFSLQKGDFRDVSTHPINHVSVQRRGGRTSMIERRPGSRWRLTVGTAVGALVIVGAAVTTGSAPAKAAPSGSPHQGGTWTAPFEAGGTNTPRCVKRTDGRGLR